MRYYYDSERKYTKRHKCKCYIHTTRRETKRDGKKRRGREGRDSAATIAKRKKNHIYNTNQENIRQEEKNMNREE